VYKLISLLKRRDDMTHAEFATWVVDEHVEFAKALPGLRKYVVNVALADDGPFDATTGYRSFEIAVAVDDEVTADRPRRRPPGLDNGGEGHVAPRLRPRLGRDPDIMLRTGK